MGQNSKIEWTTHTFNPWWGCEKVSPACTHCYAEAFAKRVGQKVWGAKSSRRFFGPKKWREPLKWDKLACDRGERARVFCASMADVFEDREDLLLERARLWELIAQTPNLDWLLLTKRPELIVEMVPAPWLEKPQANVWYGTTVENQEWAEKRLPHLVNVPAAVRFVSAEPLLGPVDFSRWLPEIHWLIVGGESGGKARPSHLSHFRSAVLQARTAKIAPFVNPVRVNCINLSILRNPYSANRLPITV